MSDDVEPRGEKQTASIPVAVLTALGALITILGLFAAGDLGMVIVGLGAVAMAGLLHLLGNRR